MRAFRAPLDIVGEVRALVADEALLITARDRIITVDLPNFWAGVATVRGVGGRRRRRAEALSRAGAALRLADLSVRFRLAGGTVARLGAGARPGLLSRLLGVAPLEIRLSGVAALFRALSR